GSGRASFRTSQREESRGAVALAGRLVGADLEKRRNHAGEKLQNCGRARVGPRLTSRIMCQDESVEEALRGQKLLVEQRPVLHGFCLDLESDAGDNLGCVAGKVSEILVVKDEQAPAKPLPGRRESRRVRKQMACHPSGDFIAARRGPLEDELLEDDVSRLV